MKFKKLTFTSMDEKVLSARIDFPSSTKPAAYALFVHCFTCTKESKAAAYISRSLTAQNIAVFRFDFTGLGESSGAFEDTTFSSNIDDLIAAAKFMRIKYEGPRIIIGHSLGGAAALKAAGEIDSVRAVVSIGAPADPGHVMRHIKNHRQEIESKGVATVTIENRQFRIGKQFLEDLKQNRMKEAIKGLNRALLVLHAPMDDTVGIENAGVIFQAARHPKSFISLDSADHLLTRPGDARYAGDLIAVWVRKYIGQA